jgi:hypothetical protein
MSQTIGTGATVPGSATKVGITKKRTGKPIKRKMKPMMFQMHRTISQHSAPISSSFSTLIPFLKTITSYGSPEAG